MEAVEWCSIWQWGKFFLSLDQTKVFDKVNHEYLWANLLRHGFWINLFGVLYSRTKSFPLINGWKSEDFLVRAGMRQGCLFESSHERVCF